MKNKINETKQRLLELKESNDILSKDIREFFEDMDEYLKSVEGSNETEYQLDALKDMERLIKKYRVFLERIICE